MSVVVSSHGLSDVTRLDGSAGWLYCSRTALEFEPKRLHFIYSFTIEFSIWREKKKVLEHKHQNITVFAETFGSAPSPRGSERRC